MKYTELEIEYRCDECKKSFKGKNVHLVNPISNIQILTPVNNFMYVDKEGTITGGASQASLDIGDKLFACPQCDHIHLFGFDKK